MAVIQLSRGYTTRVDDADVEQLSQHRWWVHVTRGGNAYAWTKIDGRHTYMHRLLMPGVKMVDHKNNDSLDNCRENLRAADHSGNAANSKTRVDNTSGLKGVSFDKSRGRWMASITVGGVQKNLGRFRTPAEAGAAYKRAAEAAFKEYARV